MKSFGNAMAEEFNSVTEKTNTKKTARPKYAKDRITKLVSSAFSHIFFREYR